MSRMIADRSPLRAGCLAGAFALAVAGGSLGAAATPKSVALAVPLPPPPLVSNPVLSATMSLDATTVWPSRAKEVVVLVEFRNRTSESIRWHKPEWLPEGDVYSSRVCLQRADGARFTANGTGGDIRGMHIGGEFTRVLPAGGVDHAGGWLGWVAPATDRWLPTGSGAFDEASPWKPLEVGEYDVWLEFSDGPMAGGERVPERMPVFGTYRSNRVRLTVVAEGAPISQSPRLKRSPAAGRWLTHRGTGLVTANSLAGYGITSQVEETAVELARGSRTLRLPLESRPPTNDPKLETGPRAITITSVGSAATCYVPLRYVAGKLGLEVRFDPRTRLYDLRRRVER